MKILTILLVIFASATSFAAEIKVGETFITIPNPNGYIMVTDKMKPLYELQKQFVAPTNLEYIAFIDKQKGAEALRGGIPNLTRRFTVQTMKTLVNAGVTTSDFLDLKRILKSENEDVIAKAQLQFPELMKNINSGIKQEHGLGEPLKTLPIPNLN